MLCVTDTCCCVTDVVRDGRCVIDAVTDTCAASHDCMLADLPEVRRLTGISTCPDCTPDGTLRRNLDHEDVKAEAIATLRARGKGAAAVVLHAVGMAATHLICDCPFLGRIAHMTVACFPGDRLHLQ